MKKTTLFLLVSVFLSAQTLRLDNFTTDIFSSSSKELKKISLDLIIDGRYVEDEKYKVIDALNVVIGSFYVENLATSKGKEELKKLLTAYSAKKNGVDIDDVYILKFEIVKKNSIDEIIKALKKAGCCQHP